MTQRIQGRPGRRGDRWFSFDNPAETAHPMTLIATCCSDDRRNAEQEVARSEPPRFYDAEMPIPGELVQGREAVTVRFQAKPDSRIATIFALRMLQADAPR